MRTIKLTRDHYQDGVQYYAGQTATLPDDVAVWLMGVQIEDKIASRKLIQTEQSADDGKSRK